MKHGLPKGAEMAETAPQSSLLGHYSSEDHEIVFRSLTALGHCHANHTPRSIVRTQKLLFLLIWQHGYMTPDAIHIESVYPPSPRSYVLTKIHLPRTSSHCRYKSRFGITIRGTVHDERNIEQTPSGAQ